MNPPIETPWLTIREAAAYARRGPRQIRRAVHDGRLRAAIVGERKQILTRREWLDQMITDEANVMSWPARRRS